MGARGRIMAAAALAALSLAACRRTTDAALPVDRVIAVAAGDFSAAGASGASVYTHAAAVAEYLEISLVAPAGTALRFFISNATGADFTVSDLSADARSAGAIPSRALPPPPGPGAVRGLPGAPPLDPGALTERPASRELTGADLPPAPYGGTPRSFWMVSDWDQQAYALTPATCRLTVAGADDRTLYVYVADADWDVQGAGITQAMVDALAGRFLAPGADDDIRGWVSGIFGAEWGTTGYSNAIPFTKELYIVLGDIDGDQAPNGGIVGYFSSENNFENDAEDFPHSNERIMFFVDSYMYANPAGGANGLWEDDDFWPEEVYATLAHEFQHMIHFYNKDVLAGAWSGADTWLDEMCSAAAEDFVADRLGIMGPRGWEDVATVAAQDTVDGRLPLFAYWPEYSLTRWVGSYENYSQVYAFGAWLARNGDGHLLFGEIVRNDGVGIQGVIDALETVSGGTRLETAASLLAQWGVACLASSVPGPAMTEPFRYNTGGALDAGSYRLGPIDLGRYKETGTGSTGLYVWAGLPDGGTSPAMSNIYFTLPPVSGANTASARLLLEAGQALTAVAIQQ